jgi:flavin-dependent dehydrogenase
VVVAAVNPLGGEGIRHGMRVARFAAEAACEALKKGGEKPFKAYERQTRAYYGSRWSQSLFLADMVYGKFSDARLDQLLGAAARFSADQMMQILFEFKFGTAIFSLGGITPTKSGAA